MLIQVLRIKNNQPLKCLTIDATLASLGRFCTFVGLSPHDGFFSLGAKVSMIAWASFA